MRKEKEMHNKDKVLFSLRKKIVVYWKGKVKTSQENRK